MNSQRADFKRRLAGATGLESELAQNRNLTSEGQALTSSGQGKSQLPNVVNVANASNVEIGTKDGTVQTPSGHPKNAIGTQQEHNRSITELTENQELKMIFESWEKLPEAIRKGILAIIEAAAK